MIQAKKLIWLEPLEYFKGAQDFSSLTFRARSSRKRNYLATLSSPFVAKTVKRRIIKRLGRSESLHFEEILVAADHIAESDLQRLIGLSLGRQYMM